MYNTGKYEMIAELQYTFHIMVVGKYVSVYAGNEACV